MRQLHMQRPAMLHRLCTDPPVSAASRMGCAASAPPSATARMSSAAACATRGAGWENRLNSGRPSAAVSCRWLAARPMRLEEQHLTARQATHRTVKAQQHRSSRAAPKPHTDRRLACSSVSRVDWSVVRLPGSHTTAAMASATAMLSSGAPRDWRSTRTRAAHLRGKGSSGMGLLEGTLTETQLRAWRGETGERRNAAMRVRVRVRVHDGTVTASCTTLLAWSAR